MSSYTPRTTQALRSSVRILDKEMQHVCCIMIPGNGRSITQAVKSCYEMAKETLGQPVAQEHLYDIGNEAVWFYIVEKGPVHKEWFGESDSTKQACEQILTIKAFMQNRLDNHALSSQDARKFTHCVDTILEAYNKHLNEASDHDSF